MKISVLRFLDTLKTKLAIITIAQNWHKAVSQGAENEYKCKNLRRPTGFKINRFYFISGTVFQHQLAWIWFLGCGTQIWMEKSSQENWFQDEPV